MVNRLRQNLLLKVVSLVSALVLYVYVQAERNPTVTRQFMASVTTARAPADYDVQTDQAQFEVAVTGPKSMIDQLKDGDIHAVVDLGNTTTGERRIPVRYRIPRLPPDATLNLSFDPPAPLMPVTVNAPRLMAPGVEFPNDPPPGYRYGRPEVKPARVKVIGKDSSVDRVARLVVMAAPLQPNEAIDGYFAVAPWDSDGLPVPGVSLAPPSVQVIVPLFSEPSSKTVPVSPSITDLPLPPFRITDVSVSPREVKIAGRPDQIDRISTIATEAISVRDLTAAQQFKTTVIAPAGVTVTGPTGRPLRGVTVRVAVSNAPSTGPAGPPAGQGSAAAQRATGRPAHP